MTDRRKFIHGISATALGALVSSASSASLLTESGAVNPAGLIDVHHHFVPPFYLAENRDQIAAAAGGRTHPAYLNWTPEQSLSAMDSLGVATAVLSLTTPGVWFGNPKKASETAHRVNEYAAELARAHPGRFSFFAVLPLPDADASLREIERACGVLNAVGVGLLSSYDDKWLGHPLYQPVFEELNRRKAVVFVHPTVGLCCRTLLPDVNPIMIEIPQDTTRAITNLLFTGTLTRFKDIRYIFPHAGGNVPMLVNRMHQYAPRDLSELAPAGIDYELRRIHYDLAGTAYRPAIAALTMVVPTTQILFGSDHPFIPLSDTVEGMTRLGFSSADLRGIGRDNALALLPGLQR